MKRKRKKHEPFVGKLSHGDEGFAGDLWGDSVLIRREETLWGE